MLNASVPVSHPLEGNDAADRDRAIARQKDAESEKCPIASWARAKSSKPALISLCA